MISTQFFSGEHEETVFFLLTCLMSCLDSACDVRDSAEIMSFICSCLSASLLHVKARLSESLTGDLRSLNSSELRLDSLLQMILPIFRRAFCILTSKSYCGPEEEICLKLLIYILREVISFHATFKQNSQNIESFEDGSLIAERASSQRIETGDDTDFFGGLDDAVFAGLDFGEADHDKPCEAEESLNLIVCKLLLESLDKAKPSGRFAIVSIASTDEMSTQGKMLVKKQYDFLSRCIIALAALDWSSSPQTPLLSKLLSVPGRFDSRADARDIAYFKNAAYAATSELCSLPRSVPQALDIARVYRQDLLCNAFEWVLDSDVLKNLPSSNLSSKASNQSPSAVKEHILYKKFQEGALSSLRNVADDIWRSCNSFGRLVDKLDRDCDNLDSKLGAWFVEYDLDIPSELPLRLRPSLEKELLDRFRLLRGIISKSALGSLAFSFETLASLMIASSSKQLMSLSQAVGKSRVNGDAAGDNYEYTKCLEVFVAYSELHVATLAWIIRQGSETSNREQIALLGHLLDHYLTPILQSKTPDIHRLLGKLLSLAASGLSNGSANAESWPTSRAILPTEEYAQAIVRRSREFLIFIAQEHLNGREMLSSGFFRSLLSFGTRNNGQSAWTIARSFCSTAYNVSSSEYVDTGPSTQRAINEYIAFVEKHKPITEERAKALLKLKQFALKTILVPKLCMERLDLKERAGVLHLLRYMLDMEQQESTFECRMDVNVLCSLVRGICTSIRLALVASVVDEDLVSVSYLVARSLMRLPATCVDGNAVGWLVDWCSSVASGKRSTEENSARTMQASYLWHFSSWLKDLGEIVVDRDELSAGRIRKYRDTLRSKHSSGDKVSWPAMDKGGPESTHEMTGLERKLFSEKENSGNVVNVYAKRRQPANSEEMRDWIPGESIRSVRRYLVDAKRAG